MKGSGATVTFTELNSNFFFIFYVNSITPDTGLAFPHDYILIFLGSNVITPLSHKSATLTGLVLPCQYNVVIILKVNPGKKHTGEHKKMED